MKKDVLQQGYFRSPTVSQDQVVFLGEDDLWTVELRGGKAHRLTSGRGEIISPVFSPDGRWIACCASEEGGTDVYVLSAEGSPLFRLTYLGKTRYVVGWTPDSQSVIFQSAHQAVHRADDAQLYQVSLEGGPVEPLPFGPATFMHQSGNGKGCVLGRNAISNFRWKRYRGGTVGEVWLDRNGKNKFEKLALPGNPVRPFWIGDHIYFVSDHEQMGNLYRCGLDGTEITAMTHQENYYVRGVQTDRQHLVYQAGGDLWAMNLEHDEHWQIPIQWHSPKTRLQRKFVYGVDYLEEVHLHPQGHKIAVTSRGKLFSMPLWEDAAVQYGHRDGVRHRLIAWMPDGKLVTVSDQQGDQECLAVFSEIPAVEPEMLIPLPPGRVQTIVCAPSANLLAFTTSRMDLYLLNLENQKCKKVDESPIKEITDVVFSPDSNWIAYCKPLSLELTAIFLLNLETGKSHQITHPVRYDFAPSFDPEGRWLYFLSARSYNPIWDTVQYAAVFTRSIKPYLITLRDDITSPFNPQPYAPGKERGQEEDAAQNEKSPKSTKKKRGKAEPEEKTITKIKIDLEGIEHRIIEFPMAESIYGQVVGLPGKILFTEFPMTGDLEDPAFETDLEDGILWGYDLEKQEAEILARDVGDIELRPAANTLLYLSSHEVRVVEAGVVVSEDGPEYPCRKTGWIDLDRIRISINYPAEWRQMFQESWRLQKEFFWTETLGGVDWNQVYQRYFPLLERVGSRSELSDIIWEMQGELGTSHAYEYGGDYHVPPIYPIGSLGADLEYSKKHKAYVIRQIYRGDVWRKNEHSPLCEPGLRIKEGDLLLAIGGTPINSQTSPEELLVNQAGQNVMLTIKSPDKKAEVRHVFVQTLRRDQRARYREWVTNNYRKVMEATEGRVGYIHLPDMQSEGIAEFHRAYLAQTDREGLIIDVRYNSGGFVSPLILEKLTHRHLGYDVPRWGASETYPYHTMKGHLIALANEFSGSDGDMFCYSFKTLQLGPLIGKRTWGGVVGIDNQYHLVDGSLTTQPQFSMWFHNSGWGIENVGVEPDIEVECFPQDYAKGKDPQLERSIAEMLRMLKEKPVHNNRLQQKPV
ncbi:MAG: PDZ domain-containing protein [SAR324 cluster bacterium]|nr:PDZ domain-containing protein [SAR324 cluster bacterium]